MSIAIFKTEGRTVLQLDCDNCGYGYRFDGDGFIDQRGLATKLGWKETTQRGGRIFLCPDCAKKLTYAKKQRRIFEREMVRPNSEEPTKCLLPKSPTSAS